MDSGGWRKSVPLVLGTAAIASTMGMLAALLGLFDGALWQTALVFGGAGALSGFVIAILKP